MQGAFVSTAEDYFPLLTFHGVIIAFTVPEKYLHASGKDPRSEILSASRNRQSAEDERVIVKLMPNEDDLEPHMITVQGRDHLKVQAERDAIVNHIRTFTGYILWRTKPASLLHF